MSDFAVSAVLTAKDAGMSAAMEKVSHTVDGFKDKMKEAFSFGMGAGVGALAGEKLAEGIKSAAEALPEFGERMEVIANSAKKAGLTAEAYQEMAYAMKMVGIPAEAMDKSFKKLNVGLAQLRNHQGPLLEGLKRLNPTLLQSLMSAKSGEDAFMMTAEAVAKETDATKRAAIAQAVFGKSGVDMLPALLKGREGLTDLTNEAKKYGAVVGEDGVAAGEKLNESMKHLNTTVAGMTNVFLGDLAEGLNPLLKGFSKFMAENKGVVKILEMVASGALVLLGVWGALKIAMMAWGAITPIIAGVGAAWEAYQLFAGGAATATEALDLALDANPIGLITIAIEALIAAVVLMIVYWKEITKALQDSWNWFNKLFDNPWISTAIGLISAPIQFAIELFRTLFDLISGKGLMAFTNLIPSWLKAPLFALLGVKDTTSGQVGGGSSTAPNTGALGGAVFQHQTIVNVHGVPGAQVDVKSKGAPISGKAPTPRPDPNSKAHY